MFKIRVAVLAALTVWSAVFAMASAEDRPVRVACIGDSITYSAFTGKREETAYPSQLQALLGDGFEVKNFGVSGATMLKVSNLPYWDLPAFKGAQEFAPDIVTIKLGTNDSKPPHWNAEKYEADYREMVDLLLALPSHPTVILIRPVPAFSENFGIRNSVILGEIIPIVDQIAADKHLTIVDAYNALLDYGDTFPDGIHPNDKGCKVIAETLAPAVKNAAKARHE